MYNIIKNVIHEGRYDLSSLLIKLDTLWLQSQITDEQKEELVNLARENANAEQSIEVLEKLKSIDVEIAKINERLTELESGSTEPTPPKPQYPPYVQGMWYYKDDTVSFEGNNYVCIAPEGTVCVWSPKEYPKYWKLLE